MPTALRSKVAAVADYFGLNVLAQECQPPDDETEERSVEYSLQKLVDVFGCTIPPCSLLAGRGSRISLA